MTAQDGPKTAQEGPKTPQDAPRAAQEPPKDPPDPPKTIKNRPKTLPKRPKIDSSFVFFSHHLLPSSSLFLFFSLRSSLFALRSASLSLRSSLLFSSSFRLFSSLLFLFSGGESHYWGLLGRSWGALARSCLPFLPQRPRNNSRPERSTLQVRPQSSLNFTSFFFSFFAPSWLPLGLPFGAFLAPSWLKFGPSCLLTPYFFENMNFQKNEPRPRREHDFGDRSGPRSAQDGPKIALRRS